METTITKQGQTVIPAALRRKYRLKTHTKLIWIDTGNGIRVVPAAKDPIKSMRGLYKGLKFTDSLLKDRRGEPAALICRRGSRMVEMHNKIC